MLAFKKNNCDILVFKRNNNNNKIIKFNISEKLTKKLRKIKKLFKF